MDYNSISDYQIDLITAGIKKGKSDYQIAIEADVTKSVVMSYRAKWHDIMRWMEELNDK